jgi:hypothetical protein
MVAKFSDPLTFFKHHPALPPLCQAFAHTNKQGLSFDRENFTFSFQDFDQAHT